MVERHERYKRWLAKIMGKDQDTFGEKEIKVQCSAFFQVISFLLLKK